MTLVIGGFMLLPLALPVGTWLFNATYNAISSLQGPPVPFATVDFFGEGRGSLVSATTMPSVTQTWEGRNLRAVRVIYRSTSGDTGSPTVVSGSVFTPLGDPPADGWPVVAIGHGTVGIDGPLRAIPVAVAARCTELRGAAGRQGLRRFGSRLPGTGHQGSAPLSGRPDGPG